MESTAVFFSWLNWDPSFVTDPMVVWKQSFLPSARAPPQGCDLGEDAYDCSYTECFTYFFSYTPTNHSTVGRHANIYNKELIVASSTTKRKNHWLLNPRSVSSLRA